MQKIPPKNKSFLSLFTMFSFVSLLLCCNDFLNFQPLSAHYSYDKMSIGLCKRVMNLYPCTWSVSEMFYQWWRNQTASLSCVQLSALTSLQFCLITPELSAIYLTNIWLLHGLPTQLFTSRFVHTLIWHCWLASGNCGLLPECHCWVLNQKRIQRELIVTATKEPNYLCCKLASICPVCTDVREVRKLFLGNKFKECAKSRRTAIRRNEAVQTCLPQMA